MARRIAGRLLHQLQKGCAVTVWQIAATAPARHLHLRPSRKVPSMTDDLTAADMAHRQRMETGSRNLREAIRLARKGINPQTPTRPVKLPPDGNERGLSGERHAERKAERYAERRERQRIPQIERIMVMHRAGSSNKEIAREFQMSWQKVASLIHMRRNAERNGFRDRYEAETWG